MNIIHQIAQVMLEALLNSLWQSFVVFVIAICILYIIRNRNAATRYLILWLILLILAFMPFVEVLLTIDRTIRPVFATDSGGEAIYHDLAQADAFRPALNANPSFPYFRPIRIPIPLKILPSLIFGLWALATTFLLLRLLKSYLYTSKIKKNLLALSPEYQEKFEEFLKLNGARRKVALYVPKNVKMPMAMGLFDPVILIPDGLIDELTEEQLKQVILHELAHIRRWDDWTNLIQKIIEKFFFWNPMILYIGRRLNLEREIACDDWVITLSGESNSYALCLTKLIELNMLTSSHTLATGVALQKKHITTRISMLLNKGRNSTPHFSLFDILLIICVTILAFTVFFEISPVVALVGQRKDSPKSIAQVEKTVVAKPVAKQVPEPEIRLPNQMPQEVNIEELPKPDKMKNVSEIQEDSSLKSIPRTIDKSAKIDKSDVYELAKPLHDDESRGFRAEIMIKTFEIERPIKHDLYEGSSVAIADKADKLADTGKPPKSNTPTLLNKLDDRSQKVRAEAKELLTDAKESTQNAIDNITDIADDKSEKIQHKVSSTFGGFGESLKDSARKLADKTESGKIGTIRNRLGSLFSSSK